MNGGKWVWQLHIMTAHVTPLLQLYQRQQEVCPLLPECSSNAWQAHCPAHRFKAVGDVKVGSPLKDILLWMPLSGCHWVLHTSTRALVISCALHPSQSL